MFPEDRLDERTPQFLDGYYGAEADHEDGAQPYAMWINTRLKLQCDGLPYTGALLTAGVRSAVGNITKCGRNG
jgi:hypothetical protein